MKEFVLVVFFIGIGLAPWSFGSPAEAGKTPIIFAACLDDARQFPSFLVMVESLRVFGGRYANAPVWLYLPKSLITPETEALTQFKAVQAEIKTSETPQEALWFPLATWVFASAAAEAEAEGKSAILAWIGGDTVFLDEPAEFDLPAGKALGYRPVFHRNICQLFDEPLDSYWKRAYELMGLRESTVFPMVTPGDDDRIRPYFQAGCLVVRPERRLLREWLKMFSLLSEDPIIKEICQKDSRKRIFTFQVGLTGAFLNNLDRKEMVELSDRINYPIFFKEMFGGKNDFHDITNAVTIRYEHFFVNPPQDWDLQLKGPKDKIAWIKERLAPKK